MSRRPLDQWSSLDEAIADAVRILDESLEVHLGGRELVGSVVLFSGGNDSSTLFHLVTSLGRATHAAHANTTIGIEETRQHVRDTSAGAGVPLLERLPPVAYEDLVLEQGFPGPGQHFKMYQRLKERPLRLVRKELVTNGRRQRVLFIAGRRRAESARRTDVPEHERIDATIWASPLANWTDAHLEEYRERFGVARNPVAEKLGMSGECLCGAFAEPGELHRIQDHYPATAQGIHQLEDRLAQRNADALGSYREQARDAVDWSRVARENGDRATAARLLREAGEWRRKAPPVPPERCRWGWGAYRGDPAGPPPLSGPLCSSCDFRADPAARAENTPAVQETMARIKSRRTS